ncbi:hypothetical protein AMELA_G00054900 [Ameiurus melas]|uniref:HECT domain-containing protein n=1 Tax=Ameiurus melas TaxID=219545 RepID=A0A7J6B758_AMEME|nr:hypothetical protein AMELA_G00054900 [Ameiurus melas]
MFKPEELRDKLYGTSKYEWAEVQKGVTYEECGPSDELIQNFWSVFFELNEEDQKTFLTFLYGTDRLPVGGLSKLRLRIVRHDYIADEQIWLYLGRDFRCNFLVIIITYGGAEKNLPQVQRVCTFQGSSSSRRGEGRAT